MLSRKRNNEVLKSKRSLKKGLSAALKLRCSETSSQLHFTETRLYFASRVLSVDRCKWFPSRLAPHKSKCSVLSEWINVTHQIASAREFLWKSLVDSRWAKLVLNAQKMCDSSAVVKYQTRSGQSERNKFRDCCRTLCTLCWVRCCEISPAARARNSFNWKKFVEIKKKPETCDGASIQAQH